MATKKNHTIVSDNYPILFGNPAFKYLNDRLNTVYKNSKLFVLVDENTYSNCFLKLALNCKKIQEAEIIEIESGEENKNIEVLTQLWVSLSESGADRSSLLINLGGGVIGDMGGFAASTFKRGIAFIQIPTTLLSQVDASVGGKLGIDLNGIKNEVGVFNNPDAVLINPEFLSTLSGKQFLSGYAEIIKHGLIADKKYWNLIRETNPLQIDNKKLNDLIHHSVFIKNSIVKKDPKEKGLRKILNFGHTVGHAIETYYLNTKTPLLHGEAIAIGMICELYLSKQKCGLPEKEFNEIINYLQQIYRHIKPNNPISKKIIDLMRFDKKNKNGNIQFALIKKTGKAVYDISCNEKEISQSLDYYFSLD